MKWWREEGLHPSILSQRDWPYTKRPPPNFSQERKVRWSKSSLTTEFNGLCDVRPSPWRRWALLTPATDSMAVKMGAWHRGYEMWDRRGPGPALPWPRLIRSSAWCWEARSVGGATDPGCVSGAGDVVPRCSSLLRPQPVTESPPTCFSLHLATRKDLHT